jgi:hypothetical protein
MRKLMLDDNTISDFLLRDITISSGNKTLREGKLILFSTKDFYLHFTLEIGGAKKHFELPYPFGVVQVNKKLFLLDFSLSAFKTEFDNLEKKIKNIGNKKRSRYYNSIIRLHST